MQFPLCVCVLSHNFYLRLLEGFHIVWRSPVKEDVGQLMAGYSFSLLPACPLLRGPCLSACSWVLSLAHTAQLLPLVLSGHQLPSPIHLKFLKKGHDCQSQEHTSVCSQFFPTAHVICWKIPGGHLGPGNQLGLEAASRAFFFHAEACSLTFFWNLPCLFVFLYYMGNL